MRDTGPGRHPLRETGIDDAAVTDGIAMRQRAFQHPSYDFHVAVRVGIKTGSRRHYVVVADQQHTVVGVGRVVAIAEGKRMSRL